MDSNARSKLWFDIHTNARGRTMEEYIITRDLQFLTRRPAFPRSKQIKGEAGSTSHCVIAN